MLTDKKDMYKKVLINNNKETDYLDTRITDLVFDTYTTFIVPQFTIGRIDLISYIHYDTVDLWWLIAQVNDVIDPITELYMGRVLRIPAVGDYYGFYNTNSIIDEIEEVFDSRTLT